MKGLLLLTSLLKTHSCRYCIRAGIRASVIDSFVPLEATSAKNLNRMAATGICRVFYFPMTDHD